MDHARKILPKMLDIRGPRQESKAFPSEMQVSSNTFPAKLWKLVNDDFYRSINWSEDGTCINIDALKFKHEVLKCIDSMFKTKNFSSFVRQLNLYGFKKIASVHPNSCEFSNSSHSHTHQQPWPPSNSSGNLQYFQHSFFKRNHPELLIRVRRASAAQKRKANDNSDQSRYPDFPPFPKTVLRDRTNFNDPYPFHKNKGPQAAYPVSLRVNKGKIFGLSLIASASSGSLVGTPTTSRFDYNNLCDQNGQLKRFVVIGRQDAYDDDPMLSDSSLLSPRMPILKAYNMSPLGNPKSSVGYALTESSLDASIAEAESAVSFLMNESFESSPSHSPQPLSPWQQEKTSSQDDAPDTDNTLTSSSSTSLQSSDFTSNSSSSNPAVSSLSSLSAPSSSSKSGTGTSSSSSSCFMPDSSASSVPSLYHTSTSSSLYTSGQSNSSSINEGIPIMDSSLQVSMIPPSSLSSSLSGKEMPQLATLPGKDIFTPSSLASIPDGGVLLQTHPGKDMTSSFMGHTNFNLPLSQQALMNPLQFQTEQQLLTEQGILMDCEEQLAAPLSQSPADFAGGLFSGHPVSSTPILSGLTGCSTPNCPCQHGKGHPMFCPPPPPPTPFQLFNVQPMNMDPF